MKQHAHVSTPLADTALFNGFWIGGFEGADHINGHGQPLDPNGRNGHRQRADEDYAALRRMGIRTVREKPSVGVCPIRARARTTLPSSRRRSWPPGMTCG